MLPSESNCLVADKSNKLPEINVPEKTLDLKAKDVRQEPPIPVERVIVTEKSPNVEKSDKVTAGTFVPESRQMVETVKTLNVRVAVSTDTAIIDEPVTLKAEEKIKIIEEKEQKNDNLIDLDAIKKEESELAADGDVANARAAERHEQLRKTLEKHKLEQRQMMQEQKMILKDIKEQKQELEREKQRLAKDESLKKAEKKTQMEGALPRNKESNNPRESEGKKKTAEISENNVERGAGEAPLGEEKGPSGIADNAKLSNGKQRRDKHGDMNTAAENGEKSLLREIPPNANGEESRKIPEDAPGKSPIGPKRLVDHREPLRDEKEKMEQMTFDNSESMKGPILNVLSKGALRKSVTTEELAKETDTRNKNEEEAANEAVEAPDKEHDIDRYSVPIALKMTNQSNVNKIITTSPNKSDSKSEPAILAIRRDILANKEREKRDVEASSANETAKTAGDRPLGKFESLAKNVNDADREICSKSTSKMGKELEKQSSPRSSTTAAQPLIKTNVYLSEQGITKTIPLDPHVVLSGEYESIRQRDLKALNLKNNIEI